MKPSHVYYNEPLWIPTDRPTIDMIDPEMF